MKAILFTQPGSTAVLTLQDVEKPRPKVNEILVKTETVGINYADILIRKGVYPAPGPLPAILSGEIEGTVEQVGDQVKHIKIGQRVTGIANAGYAAYATLQADQVFVLPPSLPLGYGLLTQGLTAQYLLTQRSHYRSVCITAAAGGVGSFTVQLAKVKGIKTIIAMVGNREKFGYVQSLGATHAISYTDPDWPEQMQVITNKAGVDLILDAVGGETGTALVLQLAVKGTLVTYGSTSGKPTQLDAQNLIYKANHVIGATIYHAAPETKQQWFTELLSWMEAGKLQVPITAYPFAEVAQAQQALENRLTMGKVILTV